MKINAMLESEIIQRILKLRDSLPPQNESIPIGIGDDMALIKLPCSELLVSSDMLLEGVHFDSSTPPRLIGRKALAVNLSDVAAMAGKPMGCTVSLGIPKTRSDEWVLEVMHGVFDLAKEFSLHVAGGDTNVWDGPFVIDVAIFASSHPKGSVTRKGSKPGDAIFVTGPLGGSIEGKHLEFTPRVHEALWLKENFNITSMMDISDGLGKDLRCLLAQGNLGCVINRSDVPLTILKSGERVSLEQAFCDGEDFELCFTAPKEEGDKILREVKSKNWSFYKIGEVTSDSRLLFDDGEVIKYQGFEHGI